MGSVNKSGKKHFVVNMLIMTATMLIIRVIGMAFNIYFTSVIGAAETGKYHLIFSAYGFMITFSVAGTGLAATRLVTQVGGCMAAARIAVAKCLRVCGVFSAVATAVVICMRQPLGHMLTGDATSPMALVILAVSLAPLAMSAVFRGYFMAIRQVGTVTMSQLAEELSQIGITLWLLQLFRGTHYAYISMLAGIACSSLIAWCFDFCAYRAFSTRGVQYADIPPVGYKALLSISLPVAAGSLLRSLLVLAENMLIPRTLARFGVADALGEYGIIKGMSIPLIMFPSVFTSSFSSLLVTELSERNAEHKPNGIRYIAGKACYYTLCFGFFVAGAVVLWHRSIAGAFYDEPGVGVYFGCLGLLVIPMYLDTVVDGMLKGLNQQMSSLRYNIADSLLRVCLILCLIPVAGAMGYIAILYISELFNLSLSLGRLIKTSGLHFRVHYVALPLVAVVVAVMMVRLLPFGMLVEAGVFAVVYGGIIFLSAHNKK